MVDWAGDYCSFLEPEVAIVVSLGRVGETTRGVDLRGFKSHRPPPRPLTIGKQVVPLCSARVAAGR